MAGHFGASFEIDQPQALRQFDVIERLEGERGRVDLAAANFQVRLIVNADRRIRVRQVGHRAQNDVGFGDNRVELCLRGARPVAQRPAFVLAGFALGRILGLADRFADLVGLAIQFVNFELFALAVSLELHETPHFGTRAASLAILFHKFHVFHDKSSVEHGQFGSSEMMQERR